MFLTLLFNRLTDKDFDNIVAILSSASGIILITLNLLILPETFFSLFAWNN